MRERKCARCGHSLPNHGPNCCVNLGGGLGALEPSRWCTCPAFVPRVPSRGPKCAECGGVRSWLIHDLPAGEPGHPGLWGGPVTHAFVPRPPRGQSQLPKGTCRHGVHLLRKQGKLPKYDPEAP